MSTTNPEAIYQRKRAKFLAVFEDYVRTEFGARCSDTEPECPVCIMWKHYDEINEYTK